MITGMATWTDGAAYAPLERPDGFATPEAPPLPVAPPAQPLTPGAVPPPLDLVVPGPSVPLAAIGAQPRAGRNPGEPFAVAAGLLTAGGAGHLPGAPRDPRQAFSSSGYGTRAAVAVTDELPPPQGDPLPPPVGAPLPLPPDPSGYPPPQLAYPAPAPAAAPQSQTLGWVALAAFALGAALPSASGWLMLVGGGLLLRTRAVTGNIGTSALGMGVVLLLWNDGALALGTLLSIALVIWLGTALRRYRPRPPGYWS